MTSLADALALGLDSPDVASGCRLLDSVPTDGVPVEEHELVATAAPSRRREFLAGRALARGLLLDLGVRAGPILPGARGAPGWPPGVVGSISHCDTVCAALVGKVGAWAWLGVDLEEDEPLPPRLIPRILRPDERDQLLSDPSPERRSRLVFSAKECFYKALAPQVDRVLAFDEVSVEWGGALDGCSSGEGRFLARFDGPKRRPAACPPELEGRWWALDGLLMTRIAVPRNGP